MDTPLAVVPLRRSGGRGSRQEAITRCRSRCLLALCLGATTSSGGPDCHGWRVQIGLVAPKKNVSKLAHQRNTAKRKLRAAIASLDRRALLESLHSKGLCEIRILLVLQRDSLKVPYPELVQQVSQCILRLVSQLSEPV